MDNPKNREYPSREAVAIIKKARELGYPLDDAVFYNNITLWQLDEMVTYKRYDA